MACPAQRRDRHGVPKRPAARARQNDERQRVVDPEDRVDDGDCGRGAKQNGTGGFERLEHRQQATRQLDTPVPCTSVVDGQTGLC